MEPVVFAAERFGFYAPFFEVLTDGLIHKTYKITANNTSAILQQVNTNVFQAPEQVVSNYQAIDSHLIKTHALKIPAALRTRDGKTTWIDNEGSCWRAFEYMNNTYTESLPAEPGKIFSAAKCYGEFTQALAGLDVDQLKPTIPGFHDLSNRYRQLQQAVEHASPERLTTSKPLRNNIEQREHLVNFYKSLKDNPDFKLRAMHHDTKLSNILFDRSTRKAVCPIDLDTTMAGYFFSDVGDMIRSMVSTRDENNPADSVSINEDNYTSILSGYQAGIGNSFTQTENKYLHHSGLLMLYMQGIRFLTDYLSNDVYYRIDYPEQNFTRALNQLTVLEKLEDFLKKKYAYEVR
jgi:Ser/Thr protein kinase RdoA (MazF antagonist)